MEFYRIAPIKQSLMLSIGNKLLCIRNIYKNLPSIDLQLSKTCVIIIPLFILYNSNVPIYI